MDLGIQVFRNLGIEILKEDQGWQKQGVGITITQHILNQQRQNPEATGGLPPCSTN